MNRRYVNKKQVSTAGYDKVRVLGMNLRGILLEWLQLLLV